MAIPPSDDTHFVGDEQRIAFDSSVASADDHVTGNGGVDELMPQDVAAADVNTLLTTMHPLLNGIPPAASSGSQGVSAAAAHAGHTKAPPPDYLLRRRRGHINLVEIDLYWPCGQFIGTFEGSTTEEFLQNLDDGCIRGVSRGSDCDPRGYYRLRWGSIWIDERRQYLRDWGIFDGCALTVFFTQVEPPWDNAPP